MAVTKIKDIFFTLLQNYKDAAIFLGLMLEYIGLPVPGESLMLMLGFISTNISDTVFSVFIAITGTFTGSMAAYAIGYRYGERVVLKIGKPFHLTKEKLDNVDEKMRKHQALYVIFSRFIPGVRHIVPYMSGMSRIKAYKYALYNLLSSVIWCTSFIFLGRITGKNWDMVSKVVGTYTLMALVLIVLLIIAFKLMKKYKSTVFIFSAAFTAFILIASEMMESELSPFDNLIYKYLSTLITQDLTRIMIVISNIGSIYVLSAISVILFALLAAKRKSLFYGITTGANLVAVSLLNLLFKLIFHRPRPEILQLIHVSGYSFPSGHSMISAAFYGYLIYLCFTFLKKPWKKILCAALVVLILIIGVSRIYLGVHYASDVICGFLAGFSWLVMFITVTEIFHKRFTAEI